MAAALTELYQHLAIAPASSSQPAVTPTPEEPIILDEDLPKPPKLQLQSFDCSYPLKGLFEAEQFFTYYAILFETHLMLYDGQTGSLEEYLLKFECLCNTPSSTPSSLLPRQSASTPLKPPLPIHRLSSAEMQPRRTKGLCFNCNEQFFRGHNVGLQSLLLLADDELTEDVPLS
ncbi:hypothetical protein Salat_0634100 [Sesamum alatum]|uniref:Uncharacterized protein n=1 Tax=Sesamum alatum TaxID=300844 RepID=A0AAE1YS80_9LAMI|nr:hypothetical protein Salat_0634100 [Sesamum alatum]